MSEMFFYWSGVALWIILGPVIVVVLLFLLFYWWDCCLLPSFANLRFAFIGKPKKETRSYYRLWKDMYSWRYKYYTRGEGNKNFSRCAMRRLIREARKESKSIRSDD